MRTFLKHLSKFLPQRLLYDELDRAFGCHLIFAIIIFNITVFQEKKKINLYEKRIPDRKILPKEI